MTDNKLNAYCEINEKFNGFVKDLYAQGYRINTGTMSGTQGEMVRIDFTKDGTKIVRLVIVEEHEYSPEVRDYYTIKQYVYECGVDYDNVARNSLTTLWQDDKHYDGWLAKVEF